MNQNNNKGVITVKYLNPYDLSNPLIWKHNVYGSLGTSFNSQQYVNYAKAVGYKYNKINNNASVFKKQPQTVKIQISKTPIPDLNSYAKVIYKDVNNKQTVYTSTVKGQTGSPIQFNKLTDRSALRQLPNGHYQFVKVGLHDKAIKNSGKNVIWVRKLRSKAKKHSQITLYYMDTNNKLIGNPRMVSGVVGSKFDLNSYKLPPDTKNKYQFDGLIDGNASYKFTDNPQGILVRVKRQPKPRAKSGTAHHNVGTISVYFMDKSHVVAVGNIQKRSGSAFYLTGQLAKRIGMPDHYQISGVYPQIKRFNHGVQKIFVSLTKHQAAQHLKVNHNDSKKNDNKAHRTKKLMDNKPTPHLKSANYKLDHKTKTSRNDKASRLDRHSVTKSSPELRPRTSQTPKELGQILIKLASSLMTLGKILKDQQKNNKD